MSETIEDDDNMLLLVVGDEDTINAQWKSSRKDLLEDPQIQVPCHSPIKEEPLDYLASAADKTGTEIFKSHNHTENSEETEEYDIEYLEEDHTEFQFAADDCNGVDNDQDYSEHDEKPSKITLRKRTSQRKPQQKKKRQRKTWQKKASQKKKTPQTKRKQQSQKSQQESQNYVSFVKQLRDEYPEMAKDEQLLVEHLVDIMRQVRPPEPPKGYCTAIKVEGDDTIKHECSVCGFRADTPPVVARHYQYYHGESYLTCYSCGIQYTNTPNLYKHEKRCRAPDAGVVLRARGHYLGRKGRGRPCTTNSRFITCNTPIAPKEKARLFCSKCPASYVHRVDLVAHENSHSGVRPFRCHRCTMAYTSAQALQRHLKLHGNFRFTCDHCGRKFKLKPALVSHLDSHRSVRKHPCLYCERRFAQKTALRHHMNKLHLNLPAAHGCPVCPKRYARLSHVKEHMDRAHGLTMITRQMYFQALPEMTDEEVSNVKRYIDVEVNEIKEPKNEDGESEHILPHVTEQTDDTPQKKKKCNTIKKKIKQERNSVPENTELSDTTLITVETKMTEETDVKTTPNQTVKTEIKLDKKEAKTTFIEATKKLVSKMKRRPPQRKETVTTESQIKVDEEIDDDLCNIEYKRKRKTVNFAPEKKNDEEMYKIVRDIKSTLSKRKMVLKNNQAEKKKSQNFYELKREFMDQLKNEIEIPEPKNEPEYLVAERESPENLNTEIKEDLASQKKEYSEDDAADDEKWKTYKDVSEKNKVIAGFLEYMKSGVIPKHVPILRRGKPTNSNI